MYYFSGLLVLLCVVLAIGQKYSSKYDNVDVDRILSNPRIFNNYIKCILDQGPCTPDGREFKDHIPDAISTNCEKCTEAQVKIIKKTSSFIMKNKPEDWDKIKKKFDPEGKYTESFTQYLKEN